MSVLVMDHPLEEQTLNVAYESSEEALFWADVVPHWRRHGSVSEDVWFSYNQKVFEQCTADMRLFPLSSVVKSFLDRKSVV